MQQSLRTDDVLLARFAVVLPTAQATSCVGNLEKSALAHDAPLGVALATAEETTEEAMEDMADIMAVMSGEFVCEGIAAKSRCLIYVLQLRKGLHWSDGVNQYDV